MISLTKELLQRPRNSSSTAKTINTGRLEGSVGMPKHIFIIPDGNRRYAKIKNISLSVLYKHISDVVTTDTIKHLLIHKRIPEVSVWGISRNNVMKRNENELSAIYDAQIHAYNLWLKDREIIDARIKFKFVGDLGLLPKHYRAAIEKLEKATENNNGPKCNILTAYGFDWELAKALNKAKDLEKEINSENIYDFLELKNPIDLVIRTGFEKRLSNGPVLQILNSELFFLDIFYPELTKSKLNEIVFEYKNRERRFGK